MNREGEKKKRENRHGKPAIHQQAGDQEESTLRGHRSKVDPSVPTYLSLWGMGIVARALGRGGGGEGGSFGQLWVWKRWKRRDFDTN